MQYVPSNLGEIFNLGSVCRLTIASTLVSMAGQFPYEQSAGVSSIAANSYNWCTVYP